MNRKRRALPPLFLNRGREPCAILAQGWQNAGPSRADFLFSLLSTKEVSTSVLPEKATPFKVLVSDNNLEKCHPGALGTSKRDLHCS